MQDMFFSASPIIFEQATKLRHNLTAEEHIFWNVVKDNQLGYKFRRQHPLAFYVVDFYVHSLKLVIEIDGENHNSTDHKEGDISRDTHLMELGIKVLRFTNFEINRELSEVLKKVKEEIDLRK
jgi:imidazole glycerol-phosphate synthase subunit HisF